MSLKSQDILIVMKLVVLGDRRWSYSSLSGDLSMSLSVVHAGVGRAIQSGLIDPFSKMPRNRAVEELLIHGVKYFFPPKRSGLTRGIPTGHAAPPLNSQFIGWDEETPVWPYSEGTVRGYGFSPIHKSAPRAATRDPDLYEILALLDAIRGGRAREALMAKEQLKERLRSQTLPSKRAEIQTI
jgi:hypothetical protein